VRDAVDQAQQNASGSSGSSSGAQMIQVGWNLADIDRDSVSQGVLEGGL
jgi:hypothetical protein